MNAGKLFGIIIILMLFLLISGIIIKASFSILADTFRTWFIFLHREYCRLVKTSRLVFRTLNETD